MAMTGLQIFKLLPNTNCKDCGFPTCLSFAMKLAAGRETLEKCPHASDELKAALGAASLPPIGKVTIGAGDRAVAIGEETVFFRHEKTFVRPPPLFRSLSVHLAHEDDSAIDGLLDAWAAINIERAGEVFRVDGVVLAESAAAIERVTAVAARAAARLPLVFIASTVGGAKTILAPIAGGQPLLVPPVDGDAAAFAKLAAELKIPLAVHGDDLEPLAQAAEQAKKLGVDSIVLAPQAAGPKDLHRLLTQIRRGALDRVHPGLAHPVFLYVGQGEFERGVLAITKFVSAIALEDQGGEAWLPLWTLRQNIYTDPQKPLQIDPGIYPIGGEPDENAPLLVTTNFSLTYFIVSTELESTGTPMRLAVVDAEGMSVLTAWSAGKFSGELVAKALKEMGATDLVAHHRVIIPGFVSVISGELEDELGEPWRVITGPQEAADIDAFFREQLAG